MGLEATFSQPNGNDAQPPTLVRVPPSPLEGKLVFIPDTSVLTDLSGRHWWAYQAWLTFLKAVQDKGCDWVWLAPQSILNQYETFLREGTLGEDFGLPLALKRLEDMLGDYDHAIVAARSNAIARAGRDWRVHSATRRFGMPNRKGRLKEDTGYADTVIIMLASELAREGIRVYVATIDIMDIASTLRGLTAKSAWARNNINLLLPSEIDKEYLKYSPDFGNFSLKAMVSGAVISALQRQWNPNLLYPCVIFEKDVKSGNAVFAAGVGVAQKERFRQFALPQQFESISGNYEAVPAVRVASMRGESATGALTSAFRVFNVSKLVVVEERSPYFLQLAWQDAQHSSYELRRTIRHEPLFRADPDFLYWQTRSVFAKATYKPVRQRAQRT